MVSWESLRDLTEEQIEEKAQEILSLMSLKQKANQMQGDKRMLPGLLRMLINYSQIKYEAGRDDTLNIPPITFSDGPRGITKGRSTCFPVSMARGASWDINLEERIGEVMGIEARAQGVNFIANVCINLLRHPAWGRAQETYSEDPTLLGALGSALVRGTQKHVMACAKHYAVNSIENSRFKVDVQIDERTLREVYLPHFKKCVAEDVASIMSAYNKVNGEYCGHNTHLLRDILKGDWQFKGFVMSDFVFGVKDGKAAIMGGMDIEMPYQWRMKPKKIVKLVNKGEIPIEIVDDSILRILRQKLRFNRHYDQQIYQPEKVACKKHIELALEAARKSIVLLKNENNLLPLNRSKIKTLAVFGRLAITPNTGDHGSSNVHPPYVITPLQGIKDLTDEAIEVQYDTGKNLDQSRELAKNVDAVVIIVGYTYKEEGEYIFSVGGDRANLSLIPDEEKLIQAIITHNKNCIVVMEGGSAIITENWREQVPAILMAWYPGMEGGTAIAEIIFGETNPTAKLPITFPKSEDQLPYFDNKVDTINYEYLHGYKHMDSRHTEPAFPFGHGLSYSSIKYSNLRTNQKRINPDELYKISVDVTNTSHIAGEEIVQLYIGYSNSAVERPQKELKTFGKIKLKPGETKTLTLTVNPKDLGYYDTRSQKWIVEKIEYKVYVGPSSRNNELLTTSFRI
jgi:beta-glucosidase